MHSHLSKMIGLYILELREKKEITQKNLAQQLKISAQFLGRIEKGEVPVPETVLKKCIQKLEMSEAKLVQIFRAAGQKEAVELLNKNKKKQKRKLA